MKTFFFFFGDHLKNNANTALRPDCLLVYSLVFLDNYDCPQGLREGGTMTPGPMMFRGPMRGPIQTALSNKRAIEIARVDQIVEISVKNFFLFQITWFRPEKQSKFRWRPFFFFFLRSHHFWDQTAAFSPSVYDITKPGAHPIWGSPSHHIWAREGAHPCLSCPRATFGSRRPWLSLGRAPELRDWGGINKF